MDAQLLLRAIRRTYVLSQRELAERSGVSKSTIGRIESGECPDPTIGAVRAVVESVGLRLTVHSRDGREFRLPAPEVVPRMRDGRRFPAHLEARPIVGMRTPWWGWFRLAWLPDDPRWNPAVPFHTYDLRARAASRVLAEHYLWNDAT